MTMIDVLALMVGSQTNILTQRLTASDNEIMCPWLNGPSGQIWEMKNQNGWPADGYAFDNNYIYQTVTEIDDAADYNNPKSYKKFSTLPGIIWMPRFYEPGSYLLPVQSPSDYITYLNGVAQPVKNLGGPVETSFSGPYLFDFGGDVNQQPYYLQVYRWGVGLSTMEQNCYIPLMGRVCWQNFKMGTNGQYALAQTTLFNKLVSGVCPKLAWVGV